jgi:hypothetical protein
VELAELPATLAGVNSLHRTAPGATGERPGLSALAGPSCKLPHRGGQNSGCGPARLVNLGPQPAQHPQTDKGRSLPLAEVVRPVRQAGKWVALRRLKPRGTLGISPPGGRTCGPSPWTPGPRCGTRSAARVTDVWPDALGGPFAARERLLAISVSPYSVFLARASGALTVAPSARLVLGARCKTGRRS